LTDFGFSTFCLSSWKEGPLLREGVYVKDRIFLTKYSFWSHPNRHEDGYNFEEAIREEVYSFGMTCFWVFFSQSTAIPSEAGITFAKMRGQMLTLCSELAQTPEMGLSRDQIAFLARFFEATLSHEAHRRCASHEIISLFETKTETSDATWTQSFGISIPENSNLIMPEFSLIKSLGQLLAIDYRVRAYIRSCFLDILKEETNPEVLRGTHFAVACCYELGFGGLADQTRRDAHLQQSGSSLEELETQLRDFKSTKGVVYFEGQFRTAMESGLIPPLDMVQALRDVPTSSDLATLMRVEIDNMERVLGVASTHIVHMKSMLANLYWEHGQTKLARDMLLACLCALENNADDVDHWDLLFVKGAVAEAETRVGNWDTAEDLLRGLIEEVTALGGRDHSETIVVKNQLALALADSGKWEEAVPLQKELREVQKERLGVGHPLTLQFTTPLLQSLIELGEYDEAEELMENIKSLRDAVWGKDSQDTLLSLMDEARLLDARGLYEEAEDVERMALERCQQSLEQDHPYTLDCMMNLALTLIHRVGIEEAEGLAKQCVAAYVRVKGERNPDTLRSRSSLAMIYKELGNWREAMNEDLQAYQGLQQELGLVHPFTLASMHGLGQDYWKLNKLNEAEEVLVQALRGQIDALGEDHRETIETKTMLGNVYAELENLEDATAMLESALASSKRKWGDDNRDTLIAAMNLATVYDDAGHVQKAIDLEEESLTKAREHLDPHDPITLTLITNLAMSYMTPSIYRHEDGVRLAEEAVRTRSTLGEDGGNAEGLAHAQNGLAQVYTRVGRLEEAKDLHELAFASRLEMFGEEHPDTEMSADKLQEVRTMFIQRQMYIT
jgi:tetratricopeptide (TPR) repeat protein